MPGADTEDSTSGLSGPGLTSSNNPAVSGGSSKIGSRPKHKRQEQIQQPTYNHSRLETAVIIQVDLFFFRSDQPQYPPIVSRVFLKKSKIPFNERRYFLKCSC